MVAQPIPSSVRRKGLVTNKCVLYDIGELQLEREGVMKLTAKLTMAAFLMMGIGAAYVRAEKVRDIRDLEETHNHIMEAIHEMERARAANHYDMAGHGEKAEKALHEAEHELHEAIEAAKHAR
jgi:hypothetical protein